VLRLTCPGKCVLFAGDAGAFSWKRIASQEGRIKCLAVAAPHHGGQIDGVYMCPHKPEDGCSCRKPLPGLLLQAAEDLSLDLQRSWMIGDAWSDVQAGEAAGMRGTILLRTGRGTEQFAQARLERMTSNLVLDNLPSAFEAILSIDSDPAIGSKS
jgi:HAD superfamily hydrolase (TIGR01662 family)